MGWEYVIPGYLIAAVAIGGYTLQMLRRGRALSARVPEERRRFLAEKADKT